MLWFILGMFLGLVIGLRDKALVIRELSDRIANGKVIQISDKLYRVKEVNINKEEN